VDRQIIDISSGAILRVIIIAVAFVFLWFIRDIILILALSIVIASAVDPLVSWLQARGLPRVFGVLAIYVGVVLFVGALMYLIVPPLAGELNALAKRFPCLLEQLFLQLQDSRLLSSKNAIFEGVGDYVGALTQELSQSAPQTFNGGLGGSLGSFMAGIFVIVGGVFSTILVVIISFYLAVRERGIEGFLRSVTPLKNEAYVVDLWRRTQHKIGLWVQGQLILAVIVGALMYIGLRFLGVPFAMVLALLGGLLELVPMVGPILAAVPAVIIAFFQGPIVGLLTIALYLLIHPLENHVLVPQIMRKTLGLSPVIIILAFLVGARLGGIVGMLLALPAAAALNELFNDLTERHKGVAVE
jgi:predicted PurR-regulated permease PerM